jgi:hypothetical protein
MSAKDWGRDITIAIIGPGLAVWFGQFQITFWIAATLVLLVVTMFLALQLWRMHRNKNQTIATPSSAGIREIPKTASTDIELSSSSCTNSFYFLGVSSNRTANNNTLLQQLAALARSGGDVRFLLFDPNSTHLERRASDEGATPEIWSKDIAATVERLSAAAIAHGTRFQIRYYSAYPIWRMIILDRRTIRLNFFLDKRRLTDSPVLELGIGDMHIQQAFLKHFDELWQSGRDAQL